VDSSGLINNKYNFLFYESDQPDYWQKETGWVIKKDSLEYFFKHDMESYGFNNHEINDFIEYWIPKLTKSDYYIIFPQENSIVNSLIKLEFSKQPNNLLRVFYLIENSTEKIQMPKHKKNTSFKREGFFITEWGVLE